MRQGEFEEIDSKTRVIVYFLKQDGPTWTHVHTVTPSDILQ